MRRDASLRQGGGNPRRINTSTVRAGAALRAGNRSSPCEPQRSRAGPYLEGHGIIASLPSTYTFIYSVSCLASTERRRIFADARCMCNVGNAPHPSHHPSATGARRQGQEGAVALSPLPLLEMSKSVSVLDNNVANLLQIGVVVCGSIDTMTATEMK